jgi:hypothetical protein
MQLVLLWPLGDEIKSFSLVNLNKQKHSVYVLLCRPADATSFQRNLHFCYRRVGAAVTYNPADSLFWFSLRGVGFKSQQGHQQYWLKFFSSLSRQMSVGSKLRSSTLTQINYLLIILSFGVICRNQSPSGLRRGSAVVLLQGLWVRISPAAWMSVSCEYWVLSGRGLCVRLITCPEESYLVRCDREASTVGRHWPTRGCRASGNIYIYTYIYIFWAEKTVAKLILFSIITSE